MAPAPLGYHCPGTDTHQREECGRSRLEPVAYLRQLPFEQLEFGNLLLDHA
jgi:hypothetical protein